MNKINKNKNNKNKKRRRIRTGRRIVIEKMSLMSNEGKELEKKGRISKTVENKDVVENKKRSDLRKISVPNQCPGRIETFVLTSTSFNQSSFDYDHHVGTSTSIKYFFYEYEYPESFAHYFQFSPH